MTHEEILERMDGANPLPDVEMITDGQLAELTVQIEEERRRPLDQHATELVRVGESARWLVKPAVAFVAACLLALSVIGVVSLVTSGDPDVADQSPATTTAATTPPTVPQWNPILATTQARTVPVPATCPPGSDPNRPGPIGQGRPTGSGELLAAAFDNRTGNIMLVDDSGGTWRFDVCSNTWAALESTGAVTGNIGGGLVYDADSDVTVVLEEDEVFVYNADSSTWTRFDNEAMDGEGAVYGSVYDPVSGLIITGRWVGESVIEAWAYDVDSNNWTLLGNLGTQGVDDPWQYDLLGYSANLDRLILTPTGVSTQKHTVLVDPRTGERTIVRTETPAITYGWPKAQFGRAGDTIFVAGIDWVEGVSDNVFHDSICGLDVDSGSWTRCFTGPARTGYEAYNWFDAMVGDPVNNRLVLINGVYGTFGSHRTDHVWAIDLETGALSELLAPSE